VAAVPDARLVVDGPFCVVQKAEMHGAHDPGSDLVSVDGIGRLMHTDVRLEGAAIYNAVMERSEAVVEVLREAAALPGTGVVLIASMDFHQVIAAPLERYRRAAQRAGGAPLLILPARSLDGDWLDGYATTLERLAEDLALGQPEPEPGRVALVGHLRDRGEGDQAGNAAELRRLVAGLGLELACTWLDGGDVAHLAEVRRAGTIVALPYARAAARHLARRLGVPLVESGLPLGLDGTRAFVRALAAATGRTEQGEAFLDVELGRLVPRLRPLVHRFLAGRAVVVHADPHLALALPGLLAELGMEVVGLVAQGGDGCLEPGERERLAALGGACQPRLELATRGPRGLEADRGTEADVLIASTLFPYAPRRATWVPFGYPNYLSHPITPRPFLGFNGIEWWVETLVEACQRADLRSPDVADERGATADPGGGE